MATVFKGDIATGTVGARFLSDSSNADPDLLTISYAEIGGGNTQIDRSIAAPGGFATVSVNAPAVGILEVLVALGPASDKGRLEVTSNGSPFDAEEIEESTRWVFTVQP